MEGSGQEVFCGDSFIPGLVCLCFIHLYKKRESWERLSVQKCRYKLSPTKETMIFPIIRYGRSKK